MEGITWEGLVARFGEAIVILLAVVGFLKVIAPVFNI